MLGPLCISVCCSEQRAQAWVIAPPWKQQAKEAFQCLPWLQLPSFPLPRNLLPPHLLRAFQALKTCLRDQPAATRHKLQTLGFDPEAPRHGIRPVKSDGGNRLVSLAAWAVPDAA